MKRFWKRFGVLTLALLVLFGSGAVLLVRPDWGFALQQALHIHPSPDLAPVSLGEGSTVWTLSDLKAHSDVAVNDVLLLVNQSHPLPDDFVAELNIYNGAEMHPQMVEAYIALRDAVEERTGDRIYVADDYRTREEQAALQGTGSDVAALVGCSEHEAALALDVYVKGYGGKSFLKSAGGREVNRICGEYGFVIRYGQGKEDVTGIPYEPWHLRYVGAPHARIMMESGLSLEEYFDLLVPEQWYASGEYLILVTGWETVTLPEDWLWCELSSDNRGHTVITLKMGCS